MSSIVLSQTAATLVSEISSPGQKRPPDRHLGRTALGRSPSTSPWTHAPATVLCYTGASPVSRFSGNPLDTRHREASALNPEAIRLLSLLD